MAAARGLGGKCQELRVGKISGRPEPALERSEGVALGPATSARFSLAPAAVSPPRVGEGLGEGSTL
jgi:hypothetical protein